MINSITQVCRCLSRVERERATGGEVGVDPYDYAMNMIKTQTQEQRSYIQLLVQRGDKVKAVQISKNTSYCDAIRRAYEDAVEDSYYAVCQSKMVILDEQIPERMNNETIRVYSRLRGGSSDEKMPQLAEPEPTNRDIMKFLSKEEETLNQERIR